MAASTPISSQRLPIGHAPATTALVSQPHRDEHDEGQISPSQAPRTIPWHPRITPYRFVVLSTTIGFGTAKAVLTQSGHEVIPITLEWVMGTALSLLLFSISAYDAREPKDVPSYLSFIFKLDCLDIFWNILSSFSVPRPFYVSDERPPPLPQLEDSHSQGEPIITPYRILVCLTVASFGMFKATLSYYGVSIAMSWMDWALAVPVTSILYCLGLYEYNSSSIWPYFFQADFSEPVHSVKTGISNTILISISAAWTIGFTYLLQHISDLSSQKVIDTTLLIFWLAWADILVAGIVAGALSFLLLVRLILKDMTDRGGLVRRCLRLIRQVVLKLLWRMFPSLRHIRTRQMARDRGPVLPPPDVNYHVHHFSLRTLRAASPHPPENHMHAAKFRLALTVFIHIYFCLSIFVFVLTGTLFSCLSVQLPSDLKPVSPTNFFGYFAWLLVACLTLFQCLVVVVWIMLMILTIVSMVAPFFEEHGQLEAKLCGLGPFKYLL